jgi:hypothetical protein
LYKALHAANIHKLVVSVETTPLDCKALAWGLKFCTHITLLKLSQCKIGDDGAAALADALDVR